MTASNLPDKIKSLDLVRRIQERVEENVESAKRIQKVVVHRAMLEQQRTLGRLKDSSQDQGLKGAQVAISGLTSVLGAVESKLPLPKKSDALGALVETLASKREEISHSSIKDYDELNVNKVKDALDTLNLYELEKVREYERAHKNRVTILREVERRLTI